MITFEMDITPLIKKLSRVQPLLRKPMKELIQQQAKLFIDAPKDGILANTPPSSSKARGNDAKKAGEVTLVRDILKVYVTAPEVYKAVAEQNPTAAKAIYSALLRGDYQEAERILRSSGTRFRNVSIGSFDPKLHKASRNKRGRVSRHVPAQIVTNFKKLDSYIRQKKKNVGMLASGWNAPAFKLRARVPTWVKRHKSVFSSVSEKEDERGYTIIMMPNVGFDKDKTQDRARRALQYRINALNRRLPYIIKAAAKKAMS